jgi:preprotein translocase subunit SecE
MATEGDKQGKEATKPSGDARPAAGRAKTASRSGAKPPRRSTGTASRPAGRAAAKPGDKSGTAKPAAKSAAAKPSAKSGTAKPASRTARSATATAKTDKGTRATKAVKSDEPATDGAGAGVNREMKRMMKKREGAADRLRRPPTVASRKRTKPLTFLKEVRGELGRVAWPTRPEVITYSIVVLVTVIFFMVVIAGIDYVALKGVLFLIDRGGR